jgi:hypothetical protein
MKPMVNMVWHIFKKDVRLLWPFILGAAGIQFVSAGVQYMLDRTSGPDRETLSTLSHLLIPATSLAAAFLIAALVHQDAIPGVRQDWLVRPVRRRDLLVAKLLFILVMVHGPILLADTLQALANGFPVGQSLGSAATRGLLLLGVLSLPALAFASFTRNMAEAVIGGVILFVTLTSLVQVLVAESHTPPTNGTGLAWIAHFAVIAVLLLGAAIIFTLQYFRRKTLLSRWLTAAVAVLAVAALFMPWQFAFRLQQRLSPFPGAAGSITAVYEPSLGKFRLPEGMVRNPDASDEASTIYLPVHIIGLPDDGVLNADRSQVRLLTANGKALYRTHGDDLLIRKEGHQGPVHFTIGSRYFNFVREINTSDLSVPQNGEAWVYQGIAFPRQVYEGIKNRRLRLEVDYSLTLLEGNSYTIPALGGDRVPSGLGRCTTKMDDDGDDINLRCVQAGLHAPCGAAFLEHNSSGRRNPAAFGCGPDYAPFLVQLAPDGLSRFETGIRFHDLSGLAKYPVDATQLPNSLVVVRVYKAQDHFTRQLVIPEIRLSDWESIEHGQVAENR